MKRLIFSDIHFHPFSYGSIIEGDGFNSRLWNQYQSALEMVRHAADLGVKYAYFCGDLTHQHGMIHTQVLHMAAALFKDFKYYGIETSAIPGNHDQHNKSGTIHSLAFLNDETLRGCWRGGDSPYYPVWDDSGIRVYGLPYTNDEETLKRFFGDIGNSNERTVLLLHQGVSGVPLSSGYVIDEKLSPGMIPEGIRAFTGHYHFFREVSPNLTVVGNLTPLNWGDIDQEKGWLIWDDETDEVEQIVQTKSPNFISWDARKDNDYSRVTGNFVRYTAPIEANAQIDTRNALVKEGALTVEFSSVIDPESSGVEQVSKVTTIGEAVREFEKKHSGRRKEIGKELREEKYSFKGGEDEIT